MDEVPWTVAAFQRRRRETWRAVRWWWLVLAVGIVGFEVPFYLERAHVHSAQRGPLSVRQTLSTQDETEGEFTVSLVSLVVIFIGGGGIIFGVRRHYRCPRCEEIPMGSWTNLGPTSYGRQSGVELFPSVCRSCRARLR
jgi:hypothetical protein